MTRLSKPIYLFGGEKSEGDSSQKMLLGGKGANLAEVCKIGIPVPPGFTITTEQCHAFYENGEKLSDGLITEIKSAVKYIESEVGKTFGSNVNPLLVSVRSGAPVSMPGMMDTILNLGLNDETVAALGKQSNNRRFALDCYRRFIQMYSNVVLDIDHHNFESVMDDIKLKHSVLNDSGLTEKHIEIIILEYKNLVKLRSGSDFPQDVTIQLLNAVTAVFKSWMNDRAIYYRKMNKIPETMGTAVNIQSMVFGNLGETSGTGVAFTRNPSSGENALYGEYLINAQGEDVVAGIRTPYSINELGKNDENREFPSMEHVMPQVYSEFCVIYKKLEEHYKDMQDIEFTIEQGKLWILQTRNGKRAARAAVKIAYDMVQDGVISKEQALKRIDPKSLDQLLHKFLDEKADKILLGKGLPASPGAASGHIALSKESAVKMVALGQKVILVRSETSPEDIEGMNVSEGILTSCGGMTSHAAVVARGMGKTCITGAKDVKFTGTSLIIGQKSLNEGDVITIDGSSGQVYLGEVPTKDPEFSPEFLEVMSWADSVRKLKVRANAETVLDATVARKFGAEGIGLCRTEHMFFDADRILSVRKMILATTKEQRESALSELLPFQKSDFEEIFMVMDGLPVNIRLLDPPLHEFLPTKQSEIEELAVLLNVDVIALESRIKFLHEENPMLGHRGCRLGITYPEIYEMQVRAIFMAATSVKSKGKSPKLEIMLPLIMNVREFDFLKKRVEDIAKDYNIDYDLGTMIEIPRAAITAGEIAKSAHYFSFGTNDLTQTTLGISRDDSPSFTPEYEKLKILDVDPFVTLDIPGVGELIRTAVESGRKTRPGLKCGVCGEHGGDPESIKFFAQIDMDYISCSPYRIPIARLAAAIANIS